jgi:hypothetical protein
MKAFLSGRLPVDRFERQYRDLYSSDATIRDEAVFRAIDDVFFAVDAYCGDAGPRDEYDIDEEQLRERVRNALRVLADLKAAV